ncbi:phenol-soluble modulin export ABC transporter permease subunit PmtD [Staphylococcus aureus]|nr:phenol-soluble modulin export ABC transporter permease subunit PmtD [Staphylococcus aureus]
MRILNIVKYDLYSIVRSSLTYLALLVVSGLIATQCIFMANDEKNTKHIIAYGSVFAAARWLLLIIGLMFVIKTITRDFSQGTIQLYMSKVKTRVGYIISKTISIILISILFAIIHYVILITVQAFSKGKNLPFSMYLDNLWFFIIFLLFYGLLLFLCTLASQKTAMIFSLGVFLVLIVPFIKPFIILIPKFGEKILDVFNYIPFAYLTNIMVDSSFDFTNWQWVISLGSIVIFFILTILFAAKKDI